MTSSSSLYSTVNTQNTKSTNSTSLYGGADTPIPTPEGDLVVRGDLIVLSGNILTTATTGNIFPDNATTINLGLAATAVNIGAGTGTTTINNNLTVGGDITADGADFGAITIAVADDRTITTTTGELRVSSNNGYIKLVSVDSIYTDNTGIFNLLNQPTTVYAFRNATTLELGDDTGTTGINNDLRIDGTNVGLAQTTVFEYDENNDRLNRPTFKSTSGNSSGLRVSAPNATTSASAAVSAFNSNDDLNGKFIQFLASGSATNPMRIRTGEYASGVFGPTGDKIAFYDGNTAYAFTNPAGPTDNTDLTTVEWVENYVTGGEFIFQKINLDDTAFIDTASTTLNAGTSQVLDTWSMTDYGSVKYQLQANSSGHGTQASEIMVINNSVDAFVSEYAVIVSGGNEIYSNISVDVVAGNVRLLADVAFNTTYFKAVRTAIKR